MVNRQVQDRQYNEIMGCESVDMVRFDLGTLLQGLHHDSVLLKDGLDLQKCCTSTIFVYLV